MSKFLTGLGLGITFFYVLVVLFLVGDRICQLQTMDLNEVGDFLAGVFGPLAILWLILGFFQQGKELRQSNEALKLQASELKSVVDQHREMVRISENQLRVDIDNIKHSRADLEAQRRPRLYLWCSDVRPRLGEVELALYITNLGGTADRVYIEIPEARFESELLNVTGTNGYPFTFIFNPGVALFTFKMDVEYVTGKFVKKYYMYVDYAAGDKPKVKFEEAESSLS